MYQPRVIVLEHAEFLEGYHGIYCFYNETVCIISAPSGYVNRIKERVEGKCPREAFDVEVLLKSMRMSDYQVIGPAYQGYRETALMEDTNSDDVVEIVTEDHLMLLQDLQRSCSKAEWEHSTLEIRRQPIMGRIKDGKIIAAGTWKANESHFLSIGILCHPDYRGKGCAKSVVHALTNKGIQMGAIMHYQTLKSNSASIGIASALGYQEFATTISIRL